MGNTVTALTTSVSSTALWGVFNDAVPFIAVAVITGFGFYIVRRIIKGLGKGKTKI